MSLGRRFYATVTDKSSSTGLQGDRNLRERTLSHRLNPKRGHTPSQRKRLRLAVVSRSKAARRCLTEQGSAAAAAVELEAENDNLNANARVTVVTVVRWVCK